MSTTRPISNWEPSPSGPPDALRINYRHASSPTSSPWQYVDIRSPSLPLLIASFEGPGRKLSLYDELDPTRPFRNVDVPELERIVREESVLVPGGEKRKLDVVVHEVDEPKGKGKGEGRKCKGCEVM